ncbi:hypothetical protein WI61_16720 [Burkholderia cepacia]|uniref:SET domain-containing protein n=1 Tax=Burkholderia cepacia TaxID=292 RepID=UPI00075F0462|nr:SET domain-containing protein [Burkholderia cepacia]KVA41111.1 hypothetical protein WI47_29955 [Burkholderia cepacia]KVA59953.1 hypothetical protein WI48_14280 [Burkholderia cepacia]KVA70293.1 hypothetical protein WI49_38300 [Burkholderia cepacia]KVA79061.1 hypothetical protein WI52_25520 [Burkholderia cepacia]KVA92765.1 hypothetical protein WI50_04740 [Burkholderia cepacia]
MTPLIETSTEAFLATICRRVAEAARTTGIAARYEAIFDVVPDLKRQIDELLASDAAAGQQAEACLNDAFESFKRDHAIARLPYSQQLDARYPYRDESLNPVLISELSDPLLARDSYAQSRVRAVMPYIDPAVSDRCRADAYGSTVLCRTIGGDDLRDPREHVLIGQRGAFAARLIRRGECIGVYGGRLMTAAMFFSCIEESFVISANSGYAIAFVDGENVLAMANTLLAYDADGLPVAQAEDGYNLEAASFDARSRCGRRFSIRAFFARHDIEPGAELRWNYRYSPELVRRVCWEAYGRGR